MPVFFEEVPVIKQQNIKRAEIYMCNLPDDGGSVQANYRPVLILQNDIGNRFAPTSVIVPISRRHKRSLPTHVKIPEGVGGMLSDSFVLCEQIRTIDKKWLGKFVGKLEPNSREFQAVEGAILLSLGFQL